jgi:hypothetical protein
MRPVGSDKHPVTHLLEAALTLEVPTVFPAKPSHRFSPLKNEFLLNYIYKSSSYLTGNTLHLPYKAQPVNAV